MRAEFREHLTARISSAWDAEMTAIVGPVHQSFESYLREYDFLGDDLYYTMCEEFGIKPLAVDGEPLNR